MKISPHYPGMDPARIEVALDEHTINRLNNGERIVLNLDFSSDADPNLEMPIQVVLTHETHYTPPPPAEAQAGAPAQVEEEDPWK